MLTAKEHYEHTFITIFRQNPRQLYNHLRHLWKTKAVPHTIIYNSKPVQHPAEKAKIFNEYFNSVFTRSNYSLPAVKDLPTPNHQLSHVDITSDDVFDALSNLDQTKAPGPDGLCPIVLKQCAYSLSTSVGAELMNM